MTRYLLDTNAISDVLKNPRSAAADQIRSRSVSDQVCTSIIVASELHYGVAKKSSVVLAARVEELLAVIEIMPFTADAYRHYGNLRVELERKGTPIGANDMLIAAHALATNSVLVTGNQREFARIRGLKLENWSAPRRRT
ncbi:MAG TPA: type II toxin-antitoxin system VapC family toxin [Acidobacteriaceae bacterium]|nr:type II toxin-antitoxin system VapC family toxin [Acidobacteriaceae bacterium]